MSGETVKIVMLRDQHISEGAFVTGRKYDVSVGVARRFVNKGFAKNLTEWPQPPDVKLVIKGNDGEHAAKQPDKATGRVEAAKEKRKGEK